MKLRTRVTLAVAIVTVVTLAIASLVTLFLVRRDELADLDRALLTQARLAARLAVIDDPTRPVFEAGPAEVPEHYEPSMQYVAVYDAAGQVLASTPSFSGMTPALARFHLGRAMLREGVAVDLEVLGQRLRGVVIPMKGNFLLYAASRSEVDTDVVFLARVLAILLGLATLATALVARWLGRRLASDVQDIAQVARDIANGNLAARVGESVRGSAETVALGADLDHMIQQLGELVRVQHNFISHAAHELMSPLTTLRGELQLALRRPRTAEDHAETIGNALSDVEALVVLAQDLLTLARVESTAPNIHEAVVADVVADAVHAAKGRADARRVEIVREDDEVAVSMKTVRGARRQLSRALRNLLDNAVFHSNPDSSVRVVVSTLPEGVAVAVEDAGPGVPEFERPHVFEPFFRGARDRGESDQGVGLGLAIARQIARSSGGDLELDSGFGPGARFVLKLRSPAG